MQPPFTHQQFQDMHESPDEIGRRLQALLEGLASRAPIKQAIMAVQTSDRAFRWEGALGESADGTPLRADAPIFIASIDKLFNATIAMKLSEQGRLDIDASILAYLSPDLTRGLHRLGGVDYSERITVRHLLGHTSGLADWWEDRPEDGPSLVDRVISEGDRACSAAGIASPSRWIARRFARPAGRSSMRSESCDSVCRGCSRPCIRCPRCSGTPVRRAVGCSTVQHRKCSWLEAWRRSPQARFPIESCPECSGRSVL